LECDKILLEKVKNVSLYQRKVNKVKRKKKKRKGERDVEEDLWAEGVRGCTARVKKIFFSEIDWMSNVWQREKKKF
jgi:hypothetical protein